MTIQVSKFKITGVSPLRMHNGNLANPLAAIPKELKKITGKKKKTEADFVEMARLEFLGGLYCTKEEGPVIPSNAIEATLVNAAKKSKQGTSAKSGIFVQKNAALEYIGPRTPEELWKEEKFRSQEVVPVNRARIVRTRPQFDTGWCAVVEVCWDDRQFDAREITKFMQVAGQDIGILENRPKYGRFSVEEIAG